MKGLLAIALGLLALGCGGPQPGSVLLVTIDTLRADRTSAYGHVRPTTPVLERLASEGALVETVYAPVGSTTPSHASIFTGRHPLSHGVTANGLELREDVPHLAELARAQGWTTAAFISAQTASSRWGLTRGFGHVDEALDQSGSSGGAAVYRNGDTTVEAALAWLEQQPADGPPLFVWLHLFDPHSPYEPPPEHAALFPVEGRGPRAEARAAYEAEVHFADAQLGRFLSAFDARPGEPLVVVTSDHGEGLWDHGWPVHSRTVYEEELRVPLVLRWTGVLEAGRRVAQPAALRDLAPTLSAAMGLEAPAWEGLDLAPWLFGAEEVDARRELLLMRPLHPDGRNRKDEKGPGIGLRSGELKVFTAPEEDRLELFDVVGDPHERFNLADERPQEAGGLARRSLELAVEEQAGAPESEPASLSPEDLERLRALGYLQ